MKLSGVGPGDEVIATSMTCVASNTPIHTFGAKVVWADIDHQTGNINPYEIEDLITPLTKAVLCVNWSGLPCDLEQVYDICNKHNIMFIQDPSIGHYIIKMKYMILLDILVIAYRLLNTSLVMVDY